MANRKISDLTALTAPVTGDLLPIVDISEAAAADKNKKITYGTFLSSVPLGTAAAPSIAFTGDTNTGIYSPGADQVAISTGGTEKLIVKSDGKVGIGDSAPGSRLTVADSSALTTTGISTCVGISLQNTSNTIGNYTSIQNRDASGDQNAEIKFFNITQDTTLQGAIAFTTRSGTGEFAEKMRLSPEGRLGIGTTSPGSLLHLADAGNITVGTTTGTKIGTATTQKIGFYNTTPVVQPTAVADATTAVDVITQLNALLAKLRTLGIIAT